MPVGDYDKRLVILTKELGKITAFAKGARKQSSAFLACCQPFSFGNFSLYPGKSAYNIMSVEMSNYFTELREDIEYVSYGLYFCEFADYMTKENNDEIEILKLLYQTLRVITKKAIPLPLIKIIFEMKMMVLNGQAPQVFECVKCGNTSEHYVFSADMGGLLCEACRAKAQNSVKLGTSAIYALQYIVSKEVEKLYTFHVSEEVKRELELCTKYYLNRYIDREFKTLEFLKSLKF
jgi:DNA repair protein RecO (recombination protein O)